MTARQQRRLEERKARKQARKAPAVEPEIAVASPSARAAVNRANAHSSTGPRTPEGKRASSRNSFKHGLYSKQLVLPGEDPAELDALRDDLRREHQPATPTEEILVNELAEHYWRLRRMRKFEARAMGAGTIEELHKGLATLPIIQRTMASAERGFHKALATLKQVQKERSTQRIAHSEPVARPSQDIPQTETPETDFVPQNPTVLTIPEENSGFVPQNSPESMHAAYSAQPKVHREAA